MRWQCSYILMIFTIIHIVVFLTFLAVTHGQGNKTKLTSDKPTHKGNPPEGNPPGGNPPEGNPPGGNPPEGNPPGGNPPGGTPPGGTPPGGNPPGGNPPGGNPNAGDDIKKEGFYTETMGFDDTTPTINENTDAPDNYPKEVEEARSGPTITLFTMISQKEFSIPQFPNSSAFAHPLRAGQLPTLDPSFNERSTGRPRKEDGYALVCQAFYMMIYVRGRYRDCSTFIFEEKVGDVYMWKDCYPTRNPEWYWTAPWIPESIHTVLVRDRSSKRLLVRDELYCNGVTMQNTSFKHTTGIAFDEYTFEPEKEKEMNLIGYLMVYRSSYAETYFVEYAWHFVVNEYIVIDETYPYIRPTTFCPIFRTKGIFCFLAMDFWDIRANETNKMDIWLYKTRVIPGVPITLHTWVEYVDDRLRERICYWHQKDCPMPGSPEGLADMKNLPAPTPLENIASFQTPLPTRSRLSTAQEQEMMLESQTGNATISPASLREVLQEDLFIIFTGLLLGFLLVFAPFVYFLGRRAGQHASQERWSAMAAAPGAVSVPLGHGGATWRGRS